MAIIAVVDLYSFNSIFYDLELSKVCIVLKTHKFEVIGFFLVCGTKLKKTIGI